VNIAYFDCFHGAAGDMLLAALLDAGLELAALEGALAALPLAGYRIEHRRVQSHGVAGSRVRVLVEGEQPQRDWRAIRAMLEGAALTERARSWALAAFELLARAEAAIHGVQPDDVHFHEVGAVDSIVDTVGVCVGLDLLGVEAAYCSALPTGSGWVRTQHGPLPVPAPATLALLAAAAAPVVPSPSRGELVTPTAAALLCALASFEQPPMRLERVGYGLGQKQFDRLNGLRVWLGNAEIGDSRSSVGHIAAPENHRHIQHPGASAAHLHEQLQRRDDPPAAAGDQQHTPVSNLQPPNLEEVVELRCNLDDATGELLAYAIERALAAGALDAWAAPLTMKKGRPGVQLACLARPADAERLAALLLRETPTLGVRYGALRRMAASRDSVRVATPWGEVRVKRKLLDGAVAGAAPEYDDCAALARAQGLPLATVYEAALAALAATPSP
jgi:uncharacterized protein (TIGR00299 family) protein